MSHDTFLIKPATRTGVIPLLGVYGLSGGGKTRSALMLARGIVGPKGRVVLIDSENRRGQIFADKIPGGYDVIDFGPPFSSARYSAALEQAMAAADIVVVDSMSHEHEGEGGLLEAHEAELDRMAGQDFAKRERCKFTAWIKPKMEHGKLVKQILRCGKPLICCLRAKEKTRMKKNGGGKQEFFTDEFPTPIYDEGFIFEMLINGEVYSKDGQGGYLRITKITNEDLFDCLPQSGEQITIAHGAAIAKWCAAPTIGGQSTTPKPAVSPDAAEIKAVKLEIWNLTEPIHRGSRKALSQHLWDELLMGDKETWETLNLPSAKEILNSVKAKLEKKEVTP